MNTMSNHNVQLTTGDSLWVLKPMNYTDLNSKASDRLTEAVVTKVGKKYYHIQILEEPEGSIRKLNKKTLLEDSTDLFPLHRGFLSKQEILDKEVIDDLVHKIRERFSATNNEEFTLNQLERIKSIIDED